MKKTKKLFILGFILLVASIIFTIIIKKIDVANLGETKTPVGLSSINNFFLTNLGVNWTIYKITEYLGYIPIIFVGFYALLGLIQLIQKKSLKKIDPEFFVLGGFFLFIFLIYILFNKLALNYRPVFIDGELEPSFPSSHTILSICTSAGIIIFNQKFHSEEKSYKIISIILAFVCSIVAVGRFLSGVHWFTDILGSILFSSAFVVLYYFSLLTFACKKLMIKS